MVTILVLKFLCLFYFSFELKILTILIITFVLLNPLSKY